MKDISVSGVLYINRLYVLAQPNLISAFKVAQLPHPSASPNSSD
jgi:hypothetical protein